MKPGSVCSSGARSLFSGSGQHPTTRPYSVWVPPGCPELSEADEARLGPLLEESLGARAELVLEVFDRFEAARPRTQDHYYLSLLGTHTEHRGAGIGMSLLADNLAQLDAVRMPAYLESTNPGNLGRYESVGFEVCGAFDLPDGGPTVTTMWHEPLSLEHSHVTCRPIVRGRSTMKRLRPRAPGGTGRDHLERRVPELLQERQRQDRHPAAADLQVVRPEDEALPDEGVCPIMKAAVYYETGAPDVFRYEDVPDPTVGPGDVLIDVEADQHRGWRHAQPAGRRSGPDAPRGRLPVRRHGGRGRAPTSSGFAVGDRAVTVGLDGSHAARRATPEGFAWKIPDDGLHRRRGVRAGAVRHGRRLPLRVRPPAGGRDGADPCRGRRGRHRRHSDGQAGRRAGSSPRRRATTAWNG